MVISKGAGPLLHPGGLLYLTLNFDGVTTLLPVLDAELDARLERIYHQTMDEIGRAHV